MVTFSFAILAHDVSHFFSGDVVGHMISGLMSVMNLSYQIGMFSLTLIGEEIIPDAIKLMGSLIAYRIKLAGDLIVDGIKIFG